MNLVINAISAKRGGAVTHLQNVLPELMSQLGDGAGRVVVWRGVAATGDQPWPSGIEYRADHRKSGGTGAVGGSWRRVWFDQVELPRSLRQDRADVLFSSANFGPWRCPCRHVLLVRNSAYFDETYADRVRSPRVRVYNRLQRLFTLRSIRSADVVLFPTRAMLDLVARHAGGPLPNWRVAHYGIRHDLFRPDTEPPRAGAGGSPVRLLNVSLYSDQKNLGTLLEAVRRLGQSEPGRFHLRLTAGFNQDWLAQSPFFPHFAGEQALYRRLHAAGLAEDVDWKAYGTMPELYRTSDVFVFPSYTEAFGNPLVEAMASGLPIVAADVPVNRELCGDAAEYFAPFDVAGCAEAIRGVGLDLERQAQLRSNGLGRARSFDWAQHVAWLIRAFQGDAA